MDTHTGLEYTNIRQQRPLDCVWGDVMDDVPDDLGDSIEESGAPSQIPIRRTDDTQELVCYHSRPSTLWDEVVHDYADRGAEQHNLHGLRALALLTRYGHGAIALPPVRGGSEGGCQVVRPKPPTKSRPS